MGETRAVSNNLLVNSQFNGMTGWEQVRGKSAIFSPRNNGSIDMYATSKNDAGHIYQYVPTIVGHKYRVTATITELGIQSDCGISFDDVLLKAGTPTVGGWINITGKRETSFEMTAQKSSSKLILGVYYRVKPANVSYSNISVVDITAVDTTLNTISTTSTTATGKGQPGGTLTIKNGATTIKTGTVDANGNYSVAIPKQAYGTTVTATVTAPGVTSSASTVVTQGAIAQTTINSITTDQTSVSGKGEPGGAVVIKNGSTQVASGTVAANGTYTITIPKQAYGTTVTATVTKNGQTSSANTVVIQGAIAQTTINGITTDQTSVTGKGEPGGAVVIKKGSTQVASGTVAANGTYTITIPKQAYGTTVTATVTKNGKTSSANTVVTQGGIAQTTINSITTDQTSVTGKGEPGGAVVIKKGSTQVASGTVAANGTYTITIPKQVEGTTVTATVTKNGKTSSANTVVTQGIIAETTINIIREDDTSVTGKGEPGGTVVIKKGSTQLASGTVAANGTYTITIPKQVEGTTVTATVTKNGKTSSADTVVARSLILVTINDITTDHTSVSGKAEPLSPVIIELEDGEIVVTEALQDGTYTAEIPKQKYGAVVKVKTITMGEKVSTASTVVTQGTIAETTINPLTSEQTSVTGKGEPNGAVVIKNGSVVLATGAVQSNGTYTITIPKQPYGSTVTATVTKNGTTSTASTVVAQGAIAQTTIHSITTQQTSVSGTGEPGAAIVIKNGETTLVFGTVPANGQYYFVIPKQAANSTVVATVMKNDQMSSASTVVVKNAPSTPVVDAVTDQSTKVTGTGEPGNTITIKIKDGDVNLTYTGLIDDFGEFSIPIDTPNAGATVDVIAKDQDNVLSEKVTQVVTDATAPNAPTVEGLKDTTTNVTGKGEANAIVTVTLASGGTITGETDANGNFSITIPKQVVGKQVSVTITDAAGNTSTATIVTVEADTLANPTVNRVSNQDTKNYRKRCGRSNCNSDCRW